MYKNNVYFILTFITFTKFDFGSKVSSTVYCAIFVRIKYMGLQDIVLYCIVMSMQLLKYIYLGLHYKHLHTTQSQTKS